MISSKARFRITVSTAMIAAALALAPSPAIAQTTTYQIRDMSLSRALREFGRVSGRQIIYTEDLVRGRRAPELRGAFTPEVALQRLLEGSGLRSETTPTGAIMILRASPLPGEAQAGGAAADEAGAQGETAVAEILVIGERFTLNADVRRTEDDPQPYVVLTREALERSGATTVEDAIKQDLPMASFPQSNSQVADPRGNSTRIALRGLDADETLILIDGRRVGATSVAGSPQQPDLSAIPLASIERIEILPATASGIYGGGATGGVVNVILRRDSSAARPPGSATAIPTTAPRRPGISISTPASRSIPKPASPSPAAFRTAIPCWSRSATCCNSAASKSSPTIRPSSSPMRRRRSARPPTSAA